MGSSTQTENPRAHILKRGGLALLVVALVGCVLVAAKASDPSAAVVCCADGIGMCHVLSGSCPQTHVQVACPCRDPY